MKAVFRLRKLLTLMAGLLLPLTCLLTLCWAGDRKAENYIKWVDFTPTYTVLHAAMQADIDTVESEAHLDWIEALAYLAVKNGGSFAHCGTREIAALKERVARGESLAEEMAGNKYYDYYYEAYSAVLGRFLGGYQWTHDDIVEAGYGLIAFSPIARGYSYNHYDDFGSSRSYGFRREHLGNDLLASVGTPVIAVESGTVEALGWNQYGGWRIGIRSDDGLRYYYYAHLRRGHPYAGDLAQGDYVTAGDVIGYVGMTGYSTVEDTNGMSVPHLHFGIQLIFDESQQDGNGEIWIDAYPIVQLLSGRRSSVVQQADGEYARRYEFIPIE